MYGGIALVVFSIEGKMPEEKETLNISDSGLEMSFLSNFNILVGILQGPTDLLEYNEDMTFVFLFYLWDLQKRKY